MSGCLKAVGCGFLLFVGVVAFAIAIGRKTPPSASPPTAAAAAPSAPTYRPRRGDNCIIKVDDEPQIWVAINEATRSRLTTLAQAKDGVGIGQLILADRVLVVEAGTAALVIDPGAFTTEIRIMGGRHAGKSGIINSEWLQPAK